MLTLRAVITGLCLSFVVIIMAHYSISIVHGSTMAIDHMPAGGIFLFFLLVLLLNPALFRINRRLHLSPNELIVVYIMILVTCSITEMGLGAQLCPMIASPFYYATSENKWVEFIHKHLKPQLFPQGRDVVQYFFEGLPPGEKIPWGAWIRPLSFWFAFIFVLYLVMLCIMVILRKQWVEKEKLVYPLVHLPLQMVEDDEKGRLIKPFFRSKLMWLGFFIPFVFSSWNGLSHHFHVIQPIKLATSGKVFQDTMGLTFRLSFPIMGFTYLVNQEIAFSLCFFNLLLFAIRGVFNITGISSTEDVGTYGCAGNPIFAHLGTGALITFVLLGLWMGRGHLKEVFGKAFGRNRADDSKEIISYNFAVWGLILGTVFLLIWLRFSGMPFLVGLLFLIFAFIFWIGLTRIVAEAGIATMVAPSIGSTQVVSSIGSSHISPQGLTSIGLTYVYSSDIRTFPMSSMAQSLKMAEKFIRRRGVFVAIILSVILAYVASNWIVLKLSYKYGGINLNSWYFVNGPQYPYKYAINHIQHPAQANKLGWLCRLAGAAVMALLTLARYRFLWWPLHPIGFAIGAVWLMDQLWLTILIVWIIKTLFLKYGGVRLFGQGRPFFLGLILGQYSAAGIWLVIDLITHHTDNCVFWI